MLPKLPTHDSVLSTPAHGLRSTNHAQELRAWFDEPPDEPPRSLDSADVERDSGFADEPSTGRVPFLIY
jgi:hypothetical protein